MKNDAPKFQVLVKKISLIRTAGYSCTIHRFVQECILNAIGQLHAKW